jgi:hypothetical protein
LQDVEQLLLADTVSDAVKAELLRCPLGVSKVVCLGIELMAMISAAIDELARVAASTAGVTLAAGSKPHHCATLVAWLHDRGHDVGSALVRLCQRSRKETMLPPAVDRPLRALLKRFKVRAYSQPSEEYDFDVPTLESRKQSYVEAVIAAEREEFERRFVPDTSVRPNADAKRAAFSYDGPDGEDYGSSGVEESKQTSALDVADEVDDDADGDVGTAQFLDLRNQVVHTMKWAPVVRGSRSGAVVSGAGATAPVVDPGVVDVLRFRGHGDPSATTDPGAAPEPDGAEGTGVEVTVRLDKETRDRLKVVDKASALAELRKRLQEEGISDIPPSVLNDPELSRLAVDDKRQFNKSTFGLLVRLPAFVKMRQALVSRIRAALSSLALTSHRHVFQFCFVVDNSNSMGKSELRS